MSDKLFVKSTLPQNKDESYPVALWERNELHPDGEVFVAGPTPVEVGTTAAVVAAIREGKIVECTSDGAKTDPSGAQPVQAAASNTAPGGDDAKAGTPADNVATVLSQPGGGVNPSAPPASQPAGTPSSSDQGK